MGAHRDVRAYNCGEDGGWWDPLHRWCVYNYRPYYQHECNLRSYRSSLGPPLVLWYPPRRRSRTGVAVSKTSFGRLPSVGQSTKNKKPIEFMQLLVWDDLVFLYEQNCKVFILPSSEYRSGSRDVKANVWNLKRAFSANRVRGFIFLLDLYYKFNIRYIAHQWFSGKIQRCHRWALGSIPGWCNLFFLFWGFRSIGFEPPPNKMHFTIQTLLETRYKQQTSSETLMYVVCTSSRCKLHVNVEGTIVFICQQQL